MKTQTNTHSTRLSLRRFLAALLCLLGCLTSSVKADDFQPMGNGVSVKFTKVTQSYWTWTFRNDRNVTLKDMDFTYTDREGTHTNLLPYSLQPGKGVGGWACFLSVGTPTIRVTKIVWADSTGNGNGGNGGSGGGNSGGSGGSGGGSSGGTVEKTGAVFSGSTSWQVVGSSIRITVGKIANQSSKVSTGSLRVRVWATRSYYTGGAISGYVIGTMNLNPLAPGYAYNSPSVKTNYVRPPSGYYYSAVTAEEYTSSGWVIRGFTTSATMQRF